MTSRPCQKCGYLSGNDWTQCEGSCPMPQSPHYQDPRKAATLCEAAQNPNGTYNGAKALAWLSEALNPGKGVPEEEVQGMWDDAVRKRDGG